MIFVIRFVENNGLGGLSDMSDLTCDVHTPRLLSSPGDQGITRRLVLHSASCYVQTTE
jgi:hypothetical protein